LPNETCAVTTGNSLTTYAALQNVFQVCEEFDLDLSQQTVAVIGVPGSIASCVATLLAPHVGRLLLVGRRASRVSQRLADELKAELVTSLDDALTEAGIFVTATSSGGCLNPDRLLPGAIVVDVGVPTDVQDSKLLRDDVLILTGGLTRLPESVERESTFLWFHDGVIPSCLGETMVLALEGRAENYSLGRELTPDQVQEIGGVAKSLGFDFSGLRSHGYPVTSSQLTAFRKTLTRKSTAVSTARSVAARQPTPEHRRPSQPGEREATRAKQAENARLRYERHINPVLAALADDSGLIPTFVRGTGTTLVRDDGERFLDFVAGFGSLNLGHNHPRITAALQQVLQDQPAGFTPSAIHPLTAELAERLTALAPDGLEMATFVNSGAEAVEAALKLARAATGRRAFLSCRGSFHGKTLGALSVTGNPEYQKLFHPLVPEAELVIPGDVEQLERQLRSRRFAAFLVEPVQAEGGMHVFPDGYLRHAEQLCRETDTLLILDEVQTGLGRTGEMFAADTFGIRPDVMTLAKSLSGGLIPIGAMLCRRDLWLSAYGSIDRFALHSTTFGGGPLACAAALETLETLIDEKLPENAQRLGRLLQTRLSALCTRHACVKEARGIGLLFGLEFHPLPVRTLQHWHGLAPDSSSQYVTENMDQKLATMPALYMQRVLLNQHRLYTQTARSQPLVLRIEPPLTITEEELERLLNALDQACEGFDYAISLTDEVIGRTAVGRHEANQHSS
jgi:3-acetyloctanal aminotransferase